MAENKRDAEDRQEKIDRLTEWFESYFEEHPVFEEYDIFKDKFYNEKNPDTLKRNFEKIKKSFKDQLNEMYPDLEQDSGLFSNPDLKKLNKFLTDLENNILKPRLNELDQIRRGEKKEEQENVHPQYAKSDPGPSTEHEKGRPKKKR